MQNHVKTVLITGAGSGIGLGIAKAFYQQEMKVILLGRSKRVIEAAQWLGKNALSYQVDITKQREVRDVFCHLRSQSIYIDILVNNAGISRLCRFLELTDETIALHYETNLLGAVYCTQLALPHMMQQKWGRIISISSVTGPFVADPGDCAYAMTKAGLIGMTKSLAIEFAPYNITANAICPGYVRTPMSIESASRSQRQHNGNVLDSIANEVPLKRLGTPDEMGALAVFLASNGAGYITGQAIIADGGHSVAETSCMGMI